MPRQLPQRKLIASSLYDVTVERRLELMLNCIDNYSIYLLDASGLIVTWNTGARKNKGYVESEVLGKHFKIFFTAEDNLKGVPQKLLDRASRYGRVESEGWRVRKGGGRFWAAVNVFAVRNPDGELLGFVKLTQDRSEKMEQDALRRARDAAIIESDAKAEVLARIAHELRTPLNAVVGFSEALKLFFDNMPDLKKQEYVTFINQSAENLSYLLEDICKHQINEEDTVVLGDDVDLRSIVSEVVSEFGSSLAHQIQIYNQDGNILARGDHSRIKQILRNFISNAAKYAGHCAHICVGHRLFGENQCEVFVDDDGPGVPLGQETAIFERYYRLDTRASASGLGFGLWLCRELARRMKAEVGCKTSPAGGARFWLRLPTSPPA